MIRYISLDDRTPMFLQHWMGPSSLNGKQCRINRKLPITSLWWHEDMTGNISPPFVHVWGWMYGQQQVCCASEMHFHRSRVWGRILIQPIRFNPRISPRTSPKFTTNYMSTNCRTLRCMVETSQILLNINRSH